VVGCVLGPWTPRDPLGSVGPLDLVPPCCPDPLLGPWSPGPTKHPGSSPQAKRISLRLSWLVSRPLGHWIFEIVGSRNPKAPCVAILVAPQKTSGSWPSSSCTRSLSGPQILIKRISCRILRRRTSWGASDWEVEQLEGCGSAELRTEQEEEQRSLWSSDCGAEDRRKWEPRIRI